MKFLIYLHLLQFLSCYCKSTQTRRGGTKLQWGTIDPLWLSMPINPPLKSSYFGNSVSISKTIAVIGAPGTCGSLDLNQVCNPIGSGSSTFRYFSRHSFNFNLFFKKGNGTVYIYTYATQFNGLSLHSTLSAPNSAVAFGWSVALSIDSAFLLISARRTGASTSIDYGFDDGYGSAYMYSHNSSTGNWDLIQSFSQNYTTNFGNSLSMLPDGSMFAVGAPSYYGNVGQVFIYKRDINSNSSWFLQQKLTSPIINSVDFGRSVVLYNNTKYNRLQIIMGSPFQHKVFIYTFDSILGIWDSSNYQTIKPVDTTAPNFGTNVGLSNEYAFVSNPILNSLFVYKYNAMSSMWSVYQTISVSPHDASAHQTGFASSFQISDDGDTLVIASTAAKKGLYLYKYNATTETYYEFSFQSTTAVSPSQGQFTVAVTPGPNYQVIVGAGSETIPCKYILHVV